MGHTSQSHRARGRGLSHRQRLEVANQRWYLRLQVWTRQCGMLGRHEKGQCSTEGLVMAPSEGSQWSGWRGGSGDTCPAQTVLFPEPQRKPSVSFAGHRIMEGLFQAKSMWHARGRSLKREERRGGGRENKEKQVSHKP